MYIESKSKGEKKDHSPKVQATISSHILLVSVFITGKSTPFLWEKNSPNMNLIALSPSESNCPIHASMNILCSWFLAAMQCRSGVVQCRVANGQLPIVFLLHCFLPTELEIEMSAHTLLLWDSAISQCVFAPNMCASLPQHLKVWLPSKSGADTSPALDNCLNSSKVCIHCK